MATWPAPKDGADAVRRWGKSGTVSVEVSRLLVEMGVRVTFEYPKRRISGHPDDLFIGQDVEGWGRPITFNPRERQEPIGVRFSGHPEALLRLFRAWHTEYAKRQGKYGSGTKKRKRTIILDVEGED